MGRFFKDRFLFWQRWLFISSLLFALAGLLLTFFGSSFIFQPYEDYLARCIFHQEQLPAEAEKIMAYVYGPFGGTMACCYILLAFIAYYPFKEKKTWARNATIVGFGIWVLLDSGGCLLYGVYFQIFVINLFSIVVKALPIIFTWQDFKKHS